MSKMDKKVCIIGLGYIGFPIACVLANSGYSVLGVDIDEKVILRINTTNHITFEAEVKDLFIKGMHDGNIKISTKIEHSDIYIITVQTPLNLENKPDISYVNAAIESITPYLRTDNLVLIESTCPIGTTEIMAKQLRAVCANIFVAYCPERILPSNILNELIHNDRVVGGIDRQSGIRASDFYRSFIHGGIEVTDSKTAEAVKLAENTYRDINIAYANELSMIADHINININELIWLANKHPRVNILQPSPGVGGHCIAIDPYFLANAAPRFVQLTLKAREVNINKTNWVIQKINKVAKENNVRTIACLGLTYKPNVPDTRQSPAIIITETLKQEFDVIAFDPYVKNIKSINYLLIKADMVVVLVAHNEFLDISNHLFHEKIFLDFTGVFIK
ncbi:nucleotide sugar dehydrogenase [Candidatus Tisiphia endosymbiont of Ditula angustiorana]|uniref:nucleotide sugar dehydrogenase n=1 Tax=Candidatus Tisiphia endosymbiont of Ditula angustiorana TaxID=3066272 RepID=UPI00312CAD79